LTGIVREEIVVMVIAGVRVRVRVSGDRLMVYRYHEISFVGR
jgi:hypothetical protein